ncbi:MAG TPA: WxL domain-containing protein [Streptosporangiaceae bacterium]
MTVMPAVVAPVTAGATACGSQVPAGSNCTLTGTLTVTAGSLTLTSAASLTWAVTLNGLNQSAVDTTAGDQQYTVDDATGSGAGWHVTTAATTFTDGSHTLANSGTFVTTGSVTSISATTAPTATCAATCTLPTNSTTYPVAITTAASSPTPVTIYDTAASTGLGQVVIGGSASPNPVGWWLNVPASVVSGSYTSTITMAIVSAP